MASTDKVVERVVCAARSGAGFALLLRAGPGRGRSWTLARIRDAARRELIPVSWPAPETLCRTRTEPPSLLLVDDVHLAGPEALAVVGALADVTGTGLVLTAPLGAPIPAELGRVDVLELPDADATDAGELLGRRAALSIPSVLAELLALSHGHPLVLRELLPTISDAQLRGRVPLPRQVRLGPASLALLRRRWAGLPAPTRRWLLLLAQGRGNLHGCVRAARRLGLTLVDLAPAEHAGVLYASAAAGVDWPEPLDPPAIMRDATLAESALVCQALVETTDPSSEPVEHPRWRAAMLAAPERGDPGGDPGAGDADGVSDALGASVLALARRGQLLDGYELAEHAAEAASDRTRELRYRVVAAELCWLAGYGEHAARLLDRLPRALPAGDINASASVLRSVITGLRESWPSGPELPVPGARDHCGTRQLARSLGTALLAGWETVPAEALTGVADRMRTAYQGNESDVADALATVIGGNSNPSPAQRRALRTVAWWHHDDDPLHPKAWPPPLLPVFIGEESGYARRYTELLGSPGLDAARSTRALLLLKLATAQAALGHWAHALASARDCLRLAEELEFWALRSEAMTSAAWVHAHRGEEAECVRLLRTSHHQRGRHTDGQHPWLVRWAYGLLQLSLARPSEAHEWMLPLRLGPPRSPQHLVIRRLSTLDFVEASVQARRVEDAQLALDEFADWAGQRPADWARLDLERCRALLAGDNAEQHHRCALEQCGSVARLATSARVELAYGGWLRRARRHQQARSHLRVAEELFDRLGARAWRDRAHAELRAAGEPASQPDRTHGRLTAQELRIAREAAAGRSNREIAESLGLSPRTVGYHLYKIFPKLDVTSRTQLATALARQFGDDRTESRLPSRP